MIIEGEKTNFRSGESSGRPWGGNISSDPFPQALSDLAKSRGYRSQLGLGQALGCKNNTVVSVWYRGKSVPSVEAFSSLVALLVPNDEKHDHLIDVYGQLLAEGRAGYLGMIADSESAKKFGKTNRSIGLTDYDKWLEQYLDKENTTISKVSRLTRLHQRTIRGIKKFGFKLSLNCYAEILQRFPESLDLTIDETDALSEAVAQTIEKAIASGHNFLEHPVGWIKKAQDQIACRTFTGAQAARELGISRERVRQIRNEFGLPYLLTEAHVEFIKSRLRPTTKNAKQI